MRYRVTVAGEPVAEFEMGEPTRHESPDPVLVVIERDDGFGAGVDVLSPGLLELGYLPLPDGEWTTVRRVDQDDT